MFRDNPYPITHDLEKSTSHREPRDSVRRTHRKGALAEKRHERRVVREYTNLAVEGRCRHGIRLPVEDSRLRRNDRDSHHDPASFFAFSTTSSIPPTI